MRYIIPSGTGFHVDVNFSRAKVDTELSDVQDIGAGNVRGTIPADPSSALGFMRHGPRVHVWLPRRHLRVEPTFA
jgi:hypothetical protein